MPDSPCADADKACLFFFGSLMDVELLSLVVERSVGTDEMVPARLDGWARVRAVDETYPVLVPGAGRSLDGVLFEATAAEVERILFFEDYDYDLEPCAPVLSDGTTVAARACFAGDRLAASDEPWTLDGWRAAGKAELMFLARRYMACFGVMDVEAAEAVWLRAKADWLAGRIGDDEERGAA